jgi:ABC-type glycerol-3-phosphate transport system substrate-binding protein
MIPRGAKNASGAYQVAILFTDPAVQTSAAALTGLAPATLTVLSTAPTDDPVAAVAYAEALYAKGWLSPMPADTDTVFSSMIGNVTSGRLTPEVALNSAERSLTSLFQQ